jgi:hypothetical protein
VKALVAAANRGGGEDNITAVAFQLSSEAPPNNLEDTVAMPALTEDGDEPDEQTREYVEADPGGDTMVVPPGELAALEASRAKRIWIVLIAIAALAVGAALVIWGLTR